MIDSKITCNQAVATDLPGFGTQVPENMQEADEWFKHWSGRSKAFMYLFLDAEDGLIRIASAGSREGRKALGAYAARHVASEDMLDIEDETLRRKG